MAARRLVVVQPLWALYHGRGDELLRDLDALGEDNYLLMQSGPLFGDAVLLDDAGAS